MRKDGYVRNSRRGFTLVELLVVIAIIGILVALLLPAIQAARESARRNSCTNNLKQQATTLQTRHDAQRAFPPGRTTTTQESVAWSFQLLPYMEEQEIYKSHDKQKRVDDPVNATAMRHPVATYYCPSRRSPAADRDFDNNDQPPLVKDVAAGGDYVANPGKKLLYGMEEGSRAPIRGVDRSEAGPMFTYSRISAKHVTDGLSKTTAIGEKHLPPETVSPSPETVDYHTGDTAFFAGDNPTTIFRASSHGIAANAEDPDREKYGSVHPGVCQFAFLDGHVQGLSTDIEQRVLELLSTVGDGEVVDTANLGG
jgi:prepilin-type N-terminal cleavage/methylation domain-containing protein/prepilin-type processing-associated H-X9-DG protein